MKHIAALVVVGASIVIAAPVHAAPPSAGATGSRGANGTTGAGGRIVVDQDLSSMQAGRAARARAQKGDCAGALDAFDAALRTSLDATLRRDRGVCHETLNHPYPAMDDYRAYLTALPDAKDADEIRARLSRLEAATGVASAAGDAKADGGGKHDKHDREGEGKGASASGSASMSFAGSASGDTSGTAAGTADAEGTSRVRANDGRPLEAIEADELQTEVADGSPLRRGRGFAIGPVLTVRRWGEDRFAWSEAIGAAFRYSFGKTSSLMAELGYMSINSTGTVSALGGLMSFFGYEARLGLDSEVDNAILLGIGGGYDRFKEGATGTVFSTFEGRARAGFRHVFGPALGLELTADGGIAALTLVDAPPGVDATTTTGFIGGTLALVVGF